MCAITCGMSKLIKSNKSSSTTFGNVCFPVGFFGMFCPEFGLRFAFLLTIPCEWICWSLSFIASKSMEEEKKQKKKKKKKTDERLCR